MEVGRNQFPFELGRIIEQIADASFVAIDLEFTGLASRRNKPDRLSLQEYYEDTKAAAERYQILQFGMTLVTEDVERGTYVLRPYNFFINPVPMRFTKIERIWSFQSGAVEFLTRHNFDFDKPYKQGVPYLSRQEASAVRNYVPEPIPDMPIKSQDKGFINAVRQAIDKWLAQDSSEREGFLNLPPDTSPSAVAQSSSKPSSPSMKASASVPQEYKFPTSFSRYQMRLIYQVVRNEYEERAVALGNRNWMQIVPYDKVREATLKADQERYREKDISKATEFRWIIEALTGGDITKIDSNIFLAAMPGDSKARDDPNILQTYIESLQTRLEKRRRILVGHNLFTDLVMIYRCFVGELPANVQDFQRSIHDLFPAIVDTKYMATSAIQELNSSSLGDLDYALQYRLTPVITVPENFDRYNDASSYHEAGFDSFLTAKVAVKLSAQIEAEKLYEPVATDQAPSSASEDEYHAPIDSAVEDEASGSMFSSITSLFSAAVKSVTSHSSEKSPPNDISSTSLPTSKISPPLDLRPFGSAQEVRTIKPGPANWANPEQLENLRKVFARSSISSVLEAESGNVESLSPLPHVGPVENGPKNDLSRGQRKQSPDLIDSSANAETLKRETSPQLMSFSSDDEAEGSNASEKDSGKTGNRESDGAERNSMEADKNKTEMMPPWDSDFWKVFGNRLRVYGCKEGMCRL
ncbi:MAG: hypothetical protein Q9160_003703 [Pyrenula sp. 1 TL-2023]